MKNYNKENNKDNNKEKVIPITAGIVTGTIAMIMSSPIVMNIAENLAIGSVTVQSNLAVAETLLGMAGMGIVGCAVGAAVGLGLDKVIKKINKNILKKNLNKTEKKEVNIDKSEDFSISKELKQKVNPDRNIDELKKDKDDFLKSRETFKKIKEYGNENIGKSEDRY
ncbi:MAG: hypothetical protein RSE41_06425 [Clostridia bacterium]